MAATKNTLAGSPSAADTLELGASGGFVQFASGADVKLLDIGTVAATGSDQSTGAALIHTINNVTDADATKAVVLPAAVAGLVRYVYNTEATAGLPIFPASGDKINGGTDDAAVTIEGKTAAKFIALDGANWMARYTADTP